MNGEDTMSEDRPSAPEERLKDLRFKQALKAMPREQADYVMEMLAGVQAEHQLTLDLCKKAQGALKMHSDELIRLRDERPKLVAELHVLRKEKDPTFVARQVSKAIVEATDRLERELRAARAQIADHERTIAELQSSKRKLREALERAREGR